LKILINGKWIDKLDQFFFEFVVQEKYYIFRNNSFLFKNGGFQRFKEDPELIIDRIREKAQREDSYLFSLVFYEYGEYLFDINSDNHLLAVFAIARFSKKLKKDKDIKKNSIQNKKYPKYEFPEKDDYLKSYERVRENIISGNTYQLNLTRRINIRRDRSPEDVFYRADNEVYGALFPISSKRYVISDSPELLFEVVDEKITVKPIKGTVSKKLKDYKRRLLDSEKDNRELMMITDLLRNDIASLIQKKTLDVIFPEYMELKDVAHLYSVVSGKLKKNITLSNILRKVFPGGSITGVPKKRTMELIKENEPDKRGFYTGSFGITFPDGRMSFNILIRSLFYDRGLYKYGSGGGITWWSKPDQEYDELLDKAKKLERLLG